MALLNTSLKLEQAPKTTLLNKIKGFFEPLANLITGLTPREREEAKVGTIPSTKLRMPYAKEPVVIRPKEAPMISLPLGVGSRLLEIIPKVVVQVIQNYKEISAKGQAKPWELPFDARRLGFDSPEIESTGRRLTDKFKTLNQTNPPQNVFDVWKNAGLSSLMVVVPDALDAFIAGNMAELGAKLTLKATKYDPMLERSLSELGLKEKGFTGQELVLRTKESLIQSKTIIDYANTIKSAKYVANKCTGEGILHLNSFFQKIQNMARDLILPLEQMGKGFQVSPIAIRPALVDPTAGMYAGFPIDKAIKSQISNLSKQGLSPAVIAKQLGVTEPVVKSVIGGIAKTAIIPTTPKELGQPAEKGIIPQEKAVLDLRNQKLTYEEIGKRLGYSAEKVRQIEAQAVKGVEPPTKPPIPPSPPQPEMPEFAGKPIEDPIAKLSELLKQAKPVRGKMEKLYTEERAKRIADVDRFINENIDQVGGEEGYAKILAKLKGELIKPEMKVSFEAIKDKLTPEQLTDLFKRIWKHPYLDNWEKISGADGLSGLLAGEIPQPSQLVLLEEIYGTDLIKNILSKRLIGAKSMDFLLDLANVPRALLATADMSAFLRQGIIEVAAHPLITGKAAAKTFQFAFSPKSFEQWFEDLPKDPLYPLIRKAKLDITDPFRISTKLAGREEAFMSRLLQEKVPIIGHVMRFAERAYVGFLNKVRVDVFKNWADELLSKGYSPVKDIDVFRAAADVTNTFTGRGSMGALNKIAPQLNTLFFSPRLITARFNAMNPVWYAKMPPEIRKKAIADFAKFVAVGLTTLALIKLSSGDNVEVESDPRSSDFGKIKVGDTRFDIWGGFQQWARAFAQITTGERKNTTTGEIISLTKDEYPFTTRKEVLLRFIEGKMAPVPALINELMSGAKTFTGEDITFETVAKEKFIPMYIQDITDAYADGGIGRAVGSGLAAFFGVGVQTWEKQKGLYPQLQIPSINIPEIKIPSIKIPEIKI